MSFDGKWKFTSRSFEFTAWVECSYAINGRSNLNVPDFSIWRQEKNCWMSQMHGKWNAPTDFFLCCKDKTKDFILNFLLPLKWSSESLLPRSSCTVKIPEIICWLERCFYFEWNLNPQKMQSHWYAISNLRYFEYFCETRFASAAWHA